ncbi:hypothetical protein [Legionella maioricensis]|uniref:Transmembrane protein n=1 Tax=Legionella maioricensis TaxID=2896528 RepID=A0A9X2D240_9GAMM|nr:hypothetical protein [Legionella maioricensis]MCL9684675.1 hypothetical protein [Legionella maioricensis]MCL9687703.1 hypothetical protein [Legionella maioricensis]
MKKPDPALTCPNPRLISAIYFGLLSVVGTILINAFLTSLGVEEKIPVFEAVILGMVIASCTGAVMGEHIIHCEKPYKVKTFWMGFFMVIASLPIFDLGLVFFMYHENSSILYVAQLHNMVYFYLYVLAYSYVLFGIALAIGAGLAAMYLRGQLVYDILSTYQPNEEIEKLPESPVEKNKIEHSDRVRITHH